MFGYTGYNYLNAAIKALGLQDKVEITWQPFELNPDMPPEGENLREHLGRKYGSSPADSQQARTHITQAGAKYGFEFNFFDDMTIVNTFDAHVLLDLAESLGKQTALKLRLFSAYFTEKKDVSKTDILLKEAQTVGINIDDAKAALIDSERREHVKAKALQWQQMGVRSVPTVVFNRSSALSGAQSQDVFMQVLSELTQTQQ